MARKTFGQKANRVLRFLLGLGNNRVFEAMVPYGFGVDKLDQGWDLLRASGMNKLSIKHVDIPANPKVLEALDDWENLWYPIVNASLKYSYPAVHEEVFLNLGQTSGPEVALTVPILVERIQKLGDTEDGKAARELLRTRGLTDAVVDQAIGLIDAIGTPKRIELPDNTEKLSATKQAEDDVWQWYLEWSTISRAAIKNRTYLRMLGFLQDSDTDEDDLDTDDLMSTGLTD